MLYNWHQNTDRDLQLGNRQWSDALEVASEHRDLQLVNRQWSDALELAPGHRQRPPARQPTVRWNGAAGPSQTVPAVPPGQPYASQTRDLLILNRSGVSYSTVTLQHWYEHAKLNVGHYFTLLHIISVISVIIHLSICLSN